MPGAHKSEIEEEGSHIARVRIKTAVPLGPVSRFRAKAVMTHRAGADLHWLVEINPCLCLISAQTRGT
jgi:hypothetical protein